MFISFKNLTSAFTLDQSSINNWASNLFAISKSSGSLLFCRFHRHQALPLEHAALCLMVLSPLSPPPSKQVLQTAEVLGSLTFARMLSISQQQKVLAVFNTAPYRCPTASELSLAHALWTYLTCSMLQIVQKPLGERGTYYIKKQTMQRDPRQRGREGENCFSCYLLPATFQIITKQMPILESHLNKVWDWTIIEENTKEK